MLLQFAFDVISTAAVYALVAITFSFIFYPTKFFHIAHGAVVVIGGYVYHAILFRALSTQAQVIPKTLLHTHQLIAALAAAAFCAAVGGGMEFLIYRPLRRRKATKLNLLLASFGAFIALESLLALTFGNQMRSNTVGAPGESLTLAGAVLTKRQLSAALAATLLALLLAVILRYSRSGQALRAVADDLVMARAVGIDPDRVFLAVFVVGSALAGLSGILISLEIDLVPTMGFDLLIKGVVAAIIGGVGSLPGAVLGALLLSFSENAAVLVLPSLWKDVVAFGVLIAMLLLRPDGILGTEPRNNT